MTWHGSDKSQQGKVCLNDEKQTLLAELAEDSEYWSKAQDFFKQVEGFELSSLTDRQEDWYYIISATLDKEHNAREAKIAFGALSEQAMHEFRKIFPERKR